MRLQTAVLTGLAGLMLNVGFGSAAFAQHDYGYREPYDYRYHDDQGRFHGSDRWRAEEIVRQAYRDILRREPDPEGMYEYTREMLYRGWSAADVRRALYTSREYAERFGRCGWGREPRYRYR